MVEHHIEDHLNPRCMETLHHLLELAYLRSEIRVGREGCLWRKKRHRLIAPEVHEALARLRVEARFLHLFKFRYREQFHGGHAQFFQVRNLICQSKVSAGSAYRRRAVGRKSTNM